MLDAVFFQSGVGIFCVALLGLVVGSFLNVVIYRIPIMMDNTERLYAQAVIEGKDPSEYNTEVFNLFVPRSRCPHCKHSIHFWQNIPIVSYVLQSGKCRHCQQPITIRYLLVELLTMLLSIAVVLTYPEPVQLAFALVFTWVLIALVFIDAERQLLPDILTLPLMWLGIIAGLGQVFVSLNDAVLGAIIGYMSLWSVYWLFRLIFRKEGMGYGDFKLTAALCAFQGAYMLPLIFLMAPVLALIFALPKKIGFGVHFAFGPFLATAGWLTFMYGGSIAAVLGLGYGY